MKIPHWGRFGNTTVWNIAYTNIHIHKHIIEVICPSGSTRVVAYIGRYIIFYLKLYMIIPTFSETVFC